jgi:SAM-dependent methyltransferase
LKMSDMLKRAAQHNRVAWDSFRRQRDEGLVNKHVDVATEILTGKSCLSPEQLSLAGNVAGKRLLDLGCGDGFELLEWARLGADVVGVDNSPLQIAAAQRAAETLGVPCQLLVADLMQLPPELLQGNFDLVFSAWVTAWIGDLDCWFHAVYQALKPGGLFLLSGGHPFSVFMNDVQSNDGVHTSYLDEGPYVQEASQSDGWNPTGDHLTTVQWSPKLGTIVTAVAQSGLRVTHLLEVEDGEAKFGLKGFPLEFILRAVKS